MKKRFWLMGLSVLMCVVLVVSFVACNVNDDVEVTYQQYKTEIDKEMKGCFDFFWNESQTDEDTKGTSYGLIVDRTSSKDYASIASVGFGLTAYVIGVEEGYVSKDEAEQRSKETLKTVLALQRKNDNKVSWNGFLAHFINMRSGANWNNSEISSIDTAIMLCGALTVGEYFGGEVKTLANDIYSEINWNSFVMSKNGKKYIAMSHKAGKDNVTGPWDYYAEQLMLYVLGAGSPVEEYRLDNRTYNDFTKKRGTYNGHSFIYSWFGSIFTYQFSHAWIDFSKYVDKDGINWFNNSVEASKAAYLYCKDSASLSKTFAEGGWGLTACDTHLGYNGFLGAPPRGWQPDDAYKAVQGTVAPCGAIGSVVFTPNESLKALKYYQTLRLLNGIYGLADSYNLDRSYFAPDYIGIDKGISIMMLANFKDNTVWNVFMQNQNIKNGLAVLEFTAV